ncbi:MAG: alkaline phosphatase family protein [Planctomycetota bacterium]|nr:alkaline phosphatase family protein [Planctomycetota bacterium]
MRKLTLCLPLLALACSEPNTPHSTFDEPPLIVIGVDGMTLPVLQPLIRAGKVPNLASLIERGVGGKLFTDVPTYSPRLWTSIATGVLAEDHGIPNFAEEDQHGNMLRDGLPFTSNSRRVPAVWNIAAENHRDVDSVAWWVSWPAEKITNGRIVASYAAQVQAAILWKPLLWDEGIPLLTFPDALQQEIAPLLDEGKPQGPLVAEYNSQFGIVPPEWKVPFQRDTLFRGTFHADRTHQRIFNKLQNSGRGADLRMLYFGLPDVAGHFFWRYREPEAYQYEVPQEMIDLLGNHIDKAYIQVDKWIGEVIDNAPSNARFLIISDHGMGPANVTKPNHPQSGAHEEGPPGIFIMAGPGVKQQGLLPAGKRKVGYIYDIAPFILDVLSLPAGSYMEGKSLRNMVMTQEWQVAHPVQEPLDYRDGFREATSPLVPGEGLSDVFIENLNQLGYVEDE